MDKPDTKEQDGLATTQQHVEGIDAGTVEKPVWDDVDDAHELFHGQPENFVYSAKEANRVRMKFDFILLPMVCKPHPTGNTILTNLSRWLEHTF